MISPAIEQLMMEHEETMMIPAENVANVMKEHPLEHAVTAVVAGWIFNDSSFR